jgi:protein-S-isoprenylcysteine O-methyltransferase Ste14
MAKPSMGKETITRDGLIGALANCSLALLYTAFAYAHVVQFQLNPRPSFLLLVAFETMVVVMVLTRSDANSILHHWQAWLSTAIGTFMPLLLRPTAGGEDLLVGQVIQVIGVSLQIAAILSLRRSFGLLPAHRGIRSSGMYAWVRHPLYAAYLIAQLGYLISNPSLYNLTVILIATGGQIARIHFEEGFLAQSEAYADYMTKTRWRLITGVW